MATSSSLFRHLSLFGATLAGQPGHGCGVHLTCVCWLLVQFELRYDEVDRARAVFERYVEILPTVKAWVRWVGTVTQTAEPQYASAHA
jgi:hypothetical protein